MHPLLNTIFQVSAPFDRKEGCLLNIPHQKAGIKGGALSSKYDNPWVHENANISKKGGGKSHDSANIS